jgi:hypothetical protein
MVMRLALGELVNSGQLAPNVDGQPAAWIVPPATDSEPNPPHGYVVSFIRHHERGFAAPASRFMRGLCHHYRVELHNFAPNAISRRPPLSVSARDSWGSWRTWISGFISSVRSCTRSPRLSRGCVARCAPAA